LGRRRRPTPLFQPLWSGGAARHGARFTPHGMGAAAIESLYCAEDALTPLLEVAGALRPPGSQWPLRFDPQLLMTLDGVLTDILDLTDVSIQQQLGRPLRSSRDPGWSRRGGIWQGRPLSHRRSNSGRRRSRRRAWPGSAIPPRKPAGRGGRGLSRALSGRPRPAEGRQPADGVFAAIVAVRGIAGLSSTDVRRLVPSGGREDARSILQSIECVTK
jgi:RES domain-containing protein